MLWLHGARQARGGGAGAAGRPAARRQGHAVDEGDAQVLLRRHRPDAAADRHGRRSPRTTRSKASRSSASRWPRCCPTSSAAPSTRRSASSGSPPPGSPPGLYIAPLLSGREPKFQKLGVDVLFYALLVVVLGSTAHRLAGHAAAPRRRLQLLARQPGPGVHQHGPRLADPAVRRPAVLGLPARPRAVAGAEEAVGNAAASSPWCSCRRPASAASTPPR